ncbi:MAG: hypothetical protein KG028_15240 [Actinobacteria bacterium]|jgi:hypothetical protein|nr:hypothetical protein [Actinomycetota bacterium]
MPRRAAEALLCVLALAVAACSGGQPEPRLIDTAGAVTDHAFHFEPSHLELDGGMPDADVPLVAEALGVDLRIWWYGTPCQKAPTVTVDEVDEGLEVTVERGPPVGLRPNEPCPDMAVGHALDLVLDREVDLEAVEARYVRE